MTRIRLAIQKEGRLTEESVALLKGINLDFDVRGRSLYAPCRNFNADILFLRDDDIPEYVQDGVCDLAIVGENVVHERGARVKVLEKLGFGCCELVIAVPRNSSITELAQLREKRIATSYPHSLKKFLSSRRINSTIVEISGSTEIAPSLDLAEAICDIVSTGSTLRMNGLSPLVSLFESQAALIAHGPSLEGRKKQLIDRLHTRIRGSVRARQTKYIMMNAPESVLPKIRRIIPSLKSPTVVPLAEPGMIAIHSVVAEEVFWDVIERLKEAGATGILVVPIEKMIM